MLKRLHAFILPAIVMCISLAAQTLLRIPAHPNHNLYPVDADARKEIAEAVEQAGKENKRILLVFGANWCGDCHALDHGFHQPNIEPVLTANFKVVHVDIGKGEKNNDVALKYHVNLHKGIPSIAVLDGAGALLADSAEFENARAMTEEDVLKFLNKWKRPATHAQQDMNAPEQPRFLDVAEQRLASGDPEGAQKLALQALNNPQAGDPTPDTKTAAEKGLAAPYHRLPY